MNGFVSENAQTYTAGRTVEGFRYEGSESSQARLKLADKSTFKHALQALKPDFEKCSDSNKSTRTQKTTRNQGKGYQTMKVWKLIRRMMSQVR